MVDVFISYSKADHTLVVKLAAMLEAQGWSVWWDNSLKPADKYRDEIMRELATARAVITVWTENSIKSDWVRAEAGRAKADGKLIPIKVAGLRYEDIPLPFGEMHTENIDRDDLVRAAVVGQLARPQLRQPSWRREWASVRYELISWLGIIGAAISLVANLNGIIHFSRLARLLFEHWTDVLAWIWRTMLFFIPQVGRADAILLSILTFSSVCIIHSAKGASHLNSTSSSQSEDSFVKAAAPWVSYFFSSFFLIGVFMSGTINAVRKDHDSLEQSYGARFFSRTFVRNAWRDDALGKLSVGNLGFLNLRIPTHYAKERAQECFDQELPKYLNAQEKGDITEMRLLQRHGQSARSAAEGWCYHQQQNNSSTIAGIADCARISKAYGIETEPTEASAMRAIGEECLRRLPEGYEDYGLAGFLWLIPVIAVVVIYFTLRQLFNLRLSQDALSLFYSA